MYKKEFFGALLLVTIVTSVMLAGFVSSKIGAQITVSPTSGKGDSEIDWVKGTGFTPGQPVIIYWDQQNSTHAIANVTADKSGNFKIEDVTVEGTYIGKHTIIAVQGSITATATYTMTVTTTPDDRILGPIQQLEDKLDNTTSGLPGIQANLTEILNDLADKPAIFETDTGFRREGDDGGLRLENGTYYIDIWSNGNFEVKAVYVDIQPESGSIGVTYQNITYYSFNDDQTFNVPCRHYSPSPPYEPTEVLSGMKAEMCPAAAAWGDILIAVKLSGITESSYYDVYVEAIVETGQSSNVYVDFTNSIEPTSLVHTH